MFTSDTIVNLRTSGVQTNEKNCYMGEDLIRSLPKGMSNKSNIQQPMHVSVEKTQQKRDKKKVVEGEYYMEREHGVWKTLKH